MKVTRYEFDGTGLFHILDLLEECEMDNSDADELARVDRIFEEYLPHPNIRWSDKTKCYFTPKGCEIFREELESLEELIRYYLEAPGLGSLEIITGEVKNIIYRDEYQVVEERT